MRNFRWLQCSDTFLLMGLDQTYLTEEWHPVAQVTLRQVYATQTPKYHVWLATHDGGTFVMQEERFPYAEEALAWTERKLEATGAGREFEDV